MKHTWTILFVSILLFSSKWSIAKTCFPNDFFKKYADIAQTKKAEVGYSLMLLNRWTGKVICTENFNQNALIYPASAIKVFVVAAALKMLDEGKLSMDQRITITQVNADSDCGGKPCGKWRIGAVRELKDILQATIIASNNITTNQLMDIVGKDRITEVAHMYGSLHTTIRRKVYVSVNPEPEIIDRNETSAQDLVNFYRELFFNRKKILSPSSRIFLLSLLKRTKHNNRLNLHFKHKYNFYHKTGSTSKSASDAGFLHMGKNRIVIIAGLQESRRRVVGGRWDFKQLANIGNEAIKKLEIRMGRRK